MLDDWTFTNPRPIHAAQEIVPILESVTEAEESTVNAPSDSLGPSYALRASEGILLRAGLEGLVLRSA